MWLRDEIPSDVKGARVLIYGYDTGFRDRESFQDLEGLASVFRRLLLSCRSQDQRCVSSLYMNEAKYLSTEFDHIV